MQGEHSSQGGRKTKPLRAQPSGGSSGTKTSLDAEEYSLSPPQKKHRLFGKDLVLAVGKVRPPWPLFPPPLLASCSPCPLALALALLAPCPPALRPSACSLNWHHTRAGLGLPKMGTQGLGDLLTES